VITTDTAGRIRLVNSAGGRLTGWPQSEAFGRNIDECLYLVNERSMARRPNPLSDIVATRGDVLDRRRYAPCCAGRFAAQHFVHRRSYQGDVGPHRRHGPGHSRHHRPKNARSGIIQGAQTRIHGVLAAGIANDFSVILSEIVTHLFAAKIFLKAGDDAYRSITSAEAAAFRASRITKQLLTFSKGGALVKERSSIKALIEDSVDSRCRDRAQPTASIFPKNLLPVDIDRVKSTRP